MADAYTISKTAERQIAEIVDYTDQTFELQQVDTSATRTWKSRLSWIIEPYDMLAKTAEPMSLSMCVRPSARLRGAVRSTYHTFAKYSPGPQLATCHCELCLNPDVEHRLLTTPLQHIPLGLLAEYTWALSGSDRAIFDADEYRHFLPRYFHFIAYGLWPNPNGEWGPTLRALGEHAYRSRWPKEEVEVIDAFFDALIEHHLTKPIESGHRADGSSFLFSEIDNLLNALAIAGGSIDRIVIEWSAHPSGSALAHAAQLVVNWGVNDLPDPGWDECRVQAGTLKLWLFRSEHADLFRVASMEEKDEPRKLLLRQAAVIIERQR